MVAGRGVEPRVQASVVTTNSSAAITGPANSFNEEDVGATIQHSGLVGGTGTILSVQSGTAATLAANANPGGTASATIIGKADQYGFTGWSPESDAESETYVVTVGGVGSPSRLTDAVTPVYASHRRVKG